MNNEEPILTELRKIAAWADMQRKITKWSLILVAVLIAVFLPGLIIFGVVMERELSSTLGSGIPEEAPDWYDVDRYVRRGEFDKAIELGEKLIQRMPQYPAAHSRLAGAHLAAGRVEEARKEYAEAFRLFPSEENEKSLAAMDRRGKAGNLQPGGPEGMKSQPSRAETNRMPSAAGSGR